MAQRIRTFFFWLHLAAGLAAGIVVLIMSVTGVLLTYEKQLIYYADTRNLAIAAPAGATRLPIDELLARVRATGLVAEPSAITVRRDPAAPIALAVGAGAMAYADPYTGRLLGRGDTGVRAFFRSMTDWHRWLAASGEYRTTGRAVTGAANLAFLFLVLSGAYLWIPRTWAWRAVKQVIWFRGGLPGKARDFNWHNTIGVWSVVPLAIIVASGAVISYPWASNLVYRVVGEAPPAPRGEAARPGARTEGRQARGDGRSERREATAPADARASLNAAWDVAERQREGWQTIVLRVPAAATAPLPFTIDEGGPGQPQYRGTLTVDPATAAIRSWEPFEAQSRGRQLRSILRFAHTGEVGGLIGQTIAGVVSLGGVFLVYTGFALTLRRFLAWRSRRGREAEVVRERTAA